jgi:sorting nexin-29
LDCTNYRDIALLCTTYKVFTNIVRHKLQNYIKYARQISGGFRIGRSTTDQLFTIKKILEKSWEHNINMYQIYVDFKQAYDTGRKCIKSGMNLAYQIN